MITAKQVFNKTKPFCVAKLLLGGATVLLSVILFAILVGIGYLFGGGGMGIAVIIWIAGTGVIRFAIMHYFGYLVKVGHIAVIAEAVSTGRIPRNQVEYGKKMVTKRFATSNVYFAIDKLVGGAVKQIQRGVERVGNALGGIPGMGAITGLANFFVEISLGYIDECCLGYTFYKKDQNAYKSAADGVVIYAQNWKHLLKNAAKTMAKTIGLSIVIALIIFIPVGLIFKLLKLSGFVAFLLACLIAWVVKFAYIDSYILCQMMIAYMEVAPDTRITFDLYEKLCGLSSKFKELFNQGRQKRTAAAPGEGAPVRRYAAPSSDGAPARRYAQSDDAETPIRRYAPAPAADSGNQAVYCGACGAQNDPGTRFCVECGTKIE